MTLFYSNFSIEKVVSTAIKDYELIGIVGTSAVSTHTAIANSSLELRRLASDSGSNPRVELVKNSIFEKGKTYQVHYEMQIVPKSKPYDGTVLQLADNIDGAVSSVWHWRSIFQLYVRSGKLIIKCDTISDNSVVNTDQVTVASISNNIWYNFDLFFTINSDGKSGSYRLYINNKLMWNKNMSNGVGSGPLNLYVGPQGPAGIDLFTRIRKLYAVSSMMPSQSTINVSDPTQPSQPIGYNPPLPPVNTKYDILYYYTNWCGKYGDYQPCDLPIDKIPSIAYAFFNIKADGTVYSANMDADLNKLYTTRNVGQPNQPNQIDSIDDGLPYHGNFGQFARLRALNSFNMSLAIGGWTWSTNFSSAVSTAVNRQNFISSLLKIFNTYKFFNGVDIDWEFPTSDGVNHGLDGNGSNKEDVNNLMIFLQDLRTALNADNKADYTITMALSASMWNMHLPLPDLAKVIDYVHIMTYDFFGGWITNGKPATHQANLYPNSAYTELSIDQAVTAYINGGFPANRIYIGAAFYSRGCICDGLGKSKQADSPDSDWGPGVCDYKTLPKSGATEYWDNVCKATYSYDSTKKIFNSYDSVDSIKAKCQYVKEKGLRGIIVWEASEDVIYSNSRSLMKALYENLMI